MSGMSFLLILPAIMLLMVFLDMTNSGIGENSRVIGSKNVLNTVHDFESNVVVAGKQVIKTKSEGVVSSGTPLTNSREAIKTELQIKVDQMSQDYRQNNGLEVECNITSVGNSEDPFSIGVNSTLYVGRDDITHQENLTLEISLVDPQYPISDPLPFIKTKNHGGVQVIINKIVFGSSLANYLQSRGVINASAYVNSTTALIIKKCPNSPYEMHGINDTNTLKNCIENGYFHESNDGACFLCRLEGKGTCSHYGMETFIVPYSSANNTNQSFNSSPSSIEHVIFNDTSPGGTYPGWKLLYYSDSRLFFIYLDNSHRQKYGLPIN